jgi:hypothetical protein
MPTCNRQAASPLSKQVNNTYHHIAVLNPSLSLPVLSLVLVSTHTRTSHTKAHQDA